MATSWLAVEILVASQFRDFPTGTPSSGSPAHSPDVIAGILVHERVRRPRRRGPFLPA